jgi:hypothetical protein
MQTNITFMICFVVKSSISIHLKDSSGHHNTPALLKKRGTTRHIFFEYPLVLFPHIVAVVFSIHVWSYNSPYSCSGLQYMYNIRMYDHIPFTALFSRLLCLLYTRHTLSLIGYSGPLAFHNMGNIVELFSMDGSITSWTDFQKATSLRKLSIDGDSSIYSLHLMFDVSHQSITMVLW